MLNVNDSNLLVGCQSGKLVTVDMPTMQVTSEVYKFYFSLYLIKTVYRLVWSLVYVY